MKKERKEADNREKEGKEIQIQRRNKRADKRKKAREEGQKVGERKKERKTNK